MFNPVGAPPSVVAGGLPQQKTSIMTFKSSTYQERVPLSSITPTERSFELSESQEQYESILESIRVYGQINPVLVRKTENGLSLIDGFVRLKAMQELGIAECTVSISDPQTDGEVVVLVISSNKGRDWTPADYFNAVKKLREVYPLQPGKRTDLTGAPYQSTAEIAKLLGKSERSLQRLIRVGGFSDELLAELSEGRISMNEAEVIVSRLADRGLENPKLKKIESELELVAFEQEVLNDSQDPQDQPYEPPHACPSKSVDTIAKPITQYCGTCRYYQELYGKGGDNA
jgi:ParB-like chromosome segregation protein Spo0J